MERVPVQPPERALQQTPLELLLTTGPEPVLALAWRPVQAWLLPRALGLVPVRPGGALLWGRHRWVQAPQLRGGLI